MNYDAVADTKSMLTDNRILKIEKLNPDAYLVYKFISVDAEYENLAQCIHKVTDGTECVHIHSANLQNTRNLSYNDLLVKTEHFLHKCPKFGKRAFEDKRINLKLQSLHPTSWVRRKGRVTSQIQATDGLVWSKRYNVCNKKSSFLNFP